MYYNRLMFDFHAHPGDDDNDAFISILNENETAAIGRTSSIGYLPWLGGIKRDRIESFIRENPFLMVGEFGLDRIKGCIECDMEDFYFMASLARSYDRLAVIHSVKSTELILKELKGMKVRRALFHCYTGSWETAKSIERAGYLISLAPRSFRCRDISRLLSLNFLLESDMRTGTKEKETIAMLYNEAERLTGVDQRARLDRIRKEIWKDSFFA